MYGLFFPKFLAVSLFLVLPKHFKLIVDQLFSQESIVGPKKMNLRLLPRQYAL
jgi:hypothetical protein